MQVPGQLNASALPGILKIVRFRISNLWAYFYQ